jgi:hypothetical protein
MKAVHRLLGVAGFMLAFAWIAPAAQVQGYLMDKMCSANAMKDAKFAPTHDVKCALEPPCQKSGYGVFTTDNKFLTFDAAGNEKALAALKATKQKDNLKVTIDGEVQGTTIKVTSLKLQ